MKVTHNSKKKFHKNKTDLTNQKINSLTVIAEGERKLYDGGTYAGQWICKCDCGKIIIVAANRLLQKKTKNQIKSCGCLNHTGPHKNSKVKDPSEISYRALKKRYLFSAKFRKIEWALNEEDCLKLFKNKCVYCGVEPQGQFNVYITKNGNYTTKNRERAKLAAIKFNGIDRHENYLY